MRCPSCGNDTGTEQATCAHCGAGLGGAPAAAAGGGGAPGPEDATVLVEHDPTLVETRFADIPPAPAAAPVPSTPPTAASGGRTRRLPPSTGWVVAGALALALVAVLIVLWPPNRSQKGGTVADAEGAATPSAPQETPQTSASPITSVQPGTTKFYVDTFAAAEGYAQPSASGPAVGLLRKGTHYVFCKKQGQRMERKSGEIHNHWWLLTNLDEVYGGGGPRAWVPALYLTRWGNDEARDNDGQDIPLCAE